ncbi:DUF490 domain-containing protein [Patiriisocius marinistellae]|uniref:DUF490 domain-containing protein n=1 Tax=Patiriisocius marinistellae TaxID=2494560 RepID=A0A5J4FYU0_9FLAO|nr:translocation/assembly module TamB domain-containing protein [Patiriisocius marinistellae]GEQ86314.1 DUF490 domain-containing protein [Patiriisocius marinistellae]
MQTRIAEKVTDGLNETYGTDIHVDRIGLNWRGEVDARDIYIADHHQDTLIFAEQLQTNVLSFRNLIYGDLGFGNINLTRAKLYVKNYKDEDSDNLTVFANKFNDSTTESTAVFKLFSNNVVIADSHVKIINENLSNPDVFSLTNLNTEASDFKVIGPKVFADIESLSLIAARGFKIENLKTDFSYGLTKMTLKDLVLETEDSKLTGTISMAYENGFSDFENTVILDGDFEPSVISTNDLKSFYDEFGKNQKIDFQGKINGTLNDFSYTNANLSTSNTRLSGDFSFKNLLKGSNAFNIDMKNHRVRTSYYDLRRFLPNILGPVLPEQLNDLGVFNYNGNTKINSIKLDTDGTFTSDLGNAKAKLVINNYSETNLADYKGKLVLNTFNLGKLAGTTSLGNITADVKFDGRGFTQASVDTKIEGTISSFEFEKYNYQNISVSGKLKDPLFNGDLVINDPNLKLEFKGLIDVSKDFNQYDFEANVTFAELNKLNLIKRDSISVFAGKVIMDMDGTNIDNVVGTINFKETFYQNEDDDFYFDDFKIISSFKEEERIIEVNSPDIVDGKISGQFLLEDIPNLFINGIGNVYANYIPQEVTTNQYIDYEFTVYNKIIEVFVPQLQLGENSRLKGSVSSDDSKFELDFKSPEIIVLDYYLGKVNVQVDNDNPLFNTYVSIDSIYTGFYNAIDFSLINKTLNDTLYIRSEFKGGKEKQDIFDLSLFHTINPQGKSVVGIKKSSIDYKGNVWYINEENNDLNKVSFDDNFKQVQIDSLMLNHNEERISLGGRLRDSTYKNLKASFKNVNIGNLVPPVDSLRLNGTMNGSLDFLQENGAYYPDANITIDAININDIEFGDLTLAVEGNEDLTRYNINTSLINNDVKSINAVGSIDVAKKNPQIDLDIRLNDFNMQAFSPFGADVVSNIRGLASGSAKVDGNYKEPNISGRLNLREAGLLIPYLNTDFDLDNSTQVVLTKNKLEIDRTDITDTKYKTKGIFFGNATHNNFSNWSLDLNIEAPERLLVLDTPPDEDELYYGTAFISGSAEIAGPIDELSIDVFATTEKGTSFKIPLSDTQSIGDDSFIKFLSPEEKQARISGEKIITEEVKGLSINFDLDINDKAEVEVVVDKVNNSTLKGRGAGTLLIRLDTKGKFNMWGEFTVIEGLYDFRYSGIIQKKIAVVPGGNINWDGQPERARLDISAKYSTDANPSVLLDNPTFNRNIPVDVIIDLTGEIIQPNLNFRIEFPRTGATVLSELEFKLQNEEDRQKQALFVIATGSFVNDEFQGTNAFAGTLADRVSGLVNQLFADEDGKFSVGLDYSQGSRLPNAETSDRVGITLQTQINERILINGKVGVPVGGVSETAIAGDIEVQWLINEDGTLRMNFFNRQADIQFIGEDQIFEQGLGMSYSVDFDTLSELIDKLFNKKITLEKNYELTPIIPDDNSPPVDFNKNGIKRED